LSLNRFETSGLITPLFANETNSIIPLRVPVYEGIDNCTFPQTPEKYMLLKIEGWFSYLLLLGNGQLNLLGMKRIVVLGRTTANSATTVLILSFVLVFLSYSSFGQENQTVNAQATSTTRSAGGDVNVLYAGSVISVLETKVGPAFSHFGYNYMRLGNLQFHYTPKAASC
jgi:hypothetical protein